METTASTQPLGNTHSKKGLGTGAKIGIGCGAIIALIILGLVIFSIIFGDKLKKFAEDAQQNPTRASATMMVSASAGTLTMVAEDDASKRYTVKDQSGKLTTIYWDASKQATVVIAGDFSAIPVVPAPPAGP